MFSEVLVGNHIEILESSDKTLIHLTGEIVSESRSMLIIKDSKNELLRIPKIAVKFALREKNRNSTRVFSGLEVLGTPQERIRKD